jgi:hypothetical protein
MQCIHCGIPSISIGHVYVCSATRSALTDFRSDVLKQLLVVTAAARSSDVLPSAHVALLGHALPWMRWYDPSSPPTILNANPNRPLAKWQKALAACRRWDRLAGVGGILPLGIRHLLCPSASALGIRERDRKRHDEEQTYNMHNLTLAILRGGKVVFERWWGRQATYIPAQRLRAPRGVRIWPGVHRTWLENHGSQSLLPGPANKLLRRDLDRRLSDGRRPVVFHMWSRRAVLVALPVVCASMVAGAPVRSLPPNHTVADGDGLEVARRAAIRERHLL